MFWCLKGYRYQILSFNLSFIESGCEGLVRTILVASPEYLHPQITFGLVLHSTWPNKIHYMYNIPVFDGICRHEWLSLSLSLSRKIYNHIYIYISICRFTPFHYQIFIAVYIATSFNTNPRHCKASRLENCIWPMEIRRPCPLSGIPGKGTSTCHNKNWDGFWGLLLVDLVD